MKSKIYPLLFLLFAVSQSLTYAQNSTLFQEDMDDMFQVNRNHVTTGLLKDYGLLLTDVAKFNGTLQSNNMADRRTWQLLYSSLYFMKFNNFATLASPEVVNASIATDNSGIIKLVGLHYNYQQFKTNAATSNLVYVQNNKIYDRTNRPTTPYETKTAFCMVPQENILQGGTQKFLFKPELFYTNVNKPPVWVNGELVSGKTLKVDFGDGAGYRNVSENTPITITYSTEGLKNLLFKITYPDGSVAQSKSQIIISDITTACSTCRNSSETPDETITLPQSGFIYPTNANMETGQALIFYGGNDNKLDKPLIIVEGFDPNNIRSYEEMFKPYFLGNTITIDGSSQTLNDHIVQAGYDIIFLNLNDGGGDIRRNGRLLENLVQWVNQKKIENSSTEKNIVIGVSMGGIIARYGLRDMEMRGINHDTKLYGSFDSPHLGANVPLGLQAALRVLAGSKINGISFSALADFSPAIKSINSIAAQQMLIYQWEGLGNGITINNGPHTAFQNEINNMGLPQMWGIRRIAIASGSECGVNQGFAPYDNLIRMTVSEDIGYLVNIFLWAFVQILDYPPVVELVPAFLSMIGNLFVTDSDLLVSGYIKALPDKQAKPIFNLKIEYRKVVLWGLAQRTRTLFSSTKSSTVDMLPLDNNSGGSINPAQLAGGSLPPNNGIIPEDLIFSFIPTASALNVGSGSVPLTTEDLSRPYSTAFRPTGVKSIPFDNFFSNPATNAFHVQVTEYNGRWLFKEFQGTPEIFSCSYQCANTTIAPLITGPDLICTNEQTYTTTNLIPGTTINWSNNNVVAYVSGQATPSYRIRPAISRGAATLSAQISGSCEPTTIHKSLWVGIPSIDTDQLLAYSPYPPVYENSRSITYNSVCKDAYTSVGVKTYGSPGGSWKFVSSNPSPISWSTDNKSINFYLWGIGQTATFRFTTGNACGTVAQDYHFRAIVCTGEQDPCNEQYSVSPNPARSLIKITAAKIPAPCNTRTATTQDSDKKSARSIQSINLFNMQGDMIHSQFMDNRSDTELNVSTLPDGIYILKIVSGDHVETHRILITK